MRNLCAPAELPRLTRDWPALKSYFLRCHGFQCLRRLWRIATQVTVQTCAVLLHLMLISLHLVLRLFVLVCVCGLCGVCAVLASGTLCGGCGRFSLVAGAVAPADPCAIAASLLLFHCCSSSSVAVDSQSNECLNTALLGDLRTKRLNWKVLPTSSSSS